MSESSEIILNGKSLAFEWILENYEDLPSEQFSQNEIQTLIFCGQWLSGQKRFSVPTSGSTGQPKSVNLTRQQMAASARMTGEALHLNKGDSALVCLSPEHIAGLMMLVRGFELGLNVTVVEPAGNPFTAFDFENGGHFHFTAFVPLQLQTILNSGETHLAVLNRMKAILVGGAEVSATLEKTIEQVETPVYQTFGMTETVSHIALRRLNGPDKVENYEALPGVEIGQNEHGCLRVKSAVTNNEWLVTNDVVEIKTENRFVWLGRIDNMINSGGVKVSAEKVERAIAEVLFEMNQGKSIHQEFFVGPLPDKIYGQVVTVVFEGVNQIQIDEKRLRVLLSKNLTKYEIPKSSYYLNSFIRTSTGKIDRKANLAKIINELEFLPKVKIPLK